MIGSEINQYKILEKIGAGGQGTVYKALDTKLNRLVVVKAQLVPLSKPSGCALFALGAAANVEKSIHKVLSKRICFKDYGCFILRDDPLMTTPPKKQTEKVYPHQVSKDAPRIRRYRCYGCMLF